MKPFIQFEASRAETSAPARELVCTVWPVSGSGEGSSLEDPVVSSQPILAGSEAGEQARLHLPSAGTYLVDVAFPNGRHTRRTIVVEENQPYRFVVQDRRYAVREQRRSAFGEIPRVFAAAVRKARGSADLEVRLVQESQQPCLRTLRDFLKRLEVKAAHAEVLDRVVDAGLFHTVPLTPNAPDYWHANSRSWLFVTGSGKHPTIIPYPGGWTSKENGNAFRIVARRNALTGAGATKWSVSLELLDPTYGALIEHLTRRDVKSSEAISASMRAQANQALYEKQENPFSAAAGAYLFSLGSLDDKERRQWMFNLYHRFAWLPDGAIALGWRLLREGRRGSDEWNEARQVLVAACERGLPYYTIGLHILVDAFNVLALSDPEDEQVSNLLAAVTGADISSVRTEPFTTLQMSRYMGMPTK